MEERELIILKKSLKIIGDFAERCDYVNSAHEYVKIHERNIESLHSLASIRGSQYFYDRINKYPKISVEELNEYLKVKRKEVSLIRFIGGLLIDKLFRLLMSRGNTFKFIEKKVQLISKLNNDLILVIENPHYELLDAERKKMNRKYE
ncbi:hypothetical protein DVK85_07150 [Flavobacterium arcticum]|uniref:Uncharacterized protein n=1 Tax=Flavobacterium arcticum TaxID=1784713 RepID=A0A345HBS3_9FLAO|nr:hypothetical protein [Flavobacterium arcticum]AXG74033.1 hypothetical protein DVK85_07150 [Flavobacterium arcticum]KAF2509010.1 hypothetical protein E0W72_10635 [Flavobacterium arcticum]